jgi:hypothetical protein
VVVDVVVEYLFPEAFERGSQRRMKAKHARVIVGPEGADRIGL